MEEQIKHLHIKRGSVKSQLTNFTKYIEQFDAINYENGRIRVQNRLEKAQTLYDTFETIQCEIDFVENRPDGAAAERELFYKSFFDITQRQKY